MGGVQKDRIANEQVLQGLEIHGQVYLFCAGN